MGSPRRFFVTWFLFFLAFFLFVAAVVWLTPRDSNCPPPGEYVVTRVTRITGPSLEGYEIVLKEGGKSKILRISPHRIKIERLEDLRRATISVDEDEVSLSLPANFKIEQGNVLFSVTIAAFLFSLVLAMAYLLVTSYRPQV